jgi:hypothetical protein
VLRLIVKKQVEGHGLMEGVATVFFEGIVGIMG